MDKDIKRLFELSDLMKDVMVKLERRRSFDAELQKIIADTGKSFRFFRCCYLSALRATVDPEYAAELERIN